MLEIVKKVRKNHFMSQLTECQFQPLLGRYQFDQN